MEGVRVQTWAGVEAATEGAIQRVLDGEGLRPYQWSNGPGDVYGAHTHPYPKVIYVLHGAITFGFPADGSAVTLHPGDRLELASGVAHAAMVGPQGVACLEAHR